MKKRIFVSILILFVFVFAAFVPAQASPNTNACWGQATKVFAQTGELGKHSSEQGNPRLGLKNLARALYDMGVIEEATMSALGAFVAAEMGLSIEACN